MFDEKLETKIKILDHKINVNSPSKSQNSQNENNHNININIADPPKEFFDRQEKPYKQN